MSSAAPLPAVPETDSVVALAGHGTVRMRHYGAKRRGDRDRALVLHFHGGAFFEGDLDSGACLARLLAAADALVVSVDYPLAPAHPFPQAVETGYAALEWLYKSRAQLAGKDARVFVAGEEAGGNLAAAVALVARDRAHPPLAGQVLVAPMLDPCTGTPSLRQATCDATACKWTEGWQKYLASPMDAEHPYAVPGRAKRLAGLPPTLVLTGGDDPMRDEALAYARRLGEAGIAVTSGLLPPTTGWPASLREAQAEMCACADTVREHLRGFLYAPMHAPMPPP
jgi:acetyl esterase